jgi:RNA polymerase sigma-70 factor (ECF subfamily)
MQNDNNDAKLIAGITRQNHDDFAEFVSRYMLSIMNFIHRYIGNRAQVEDIAQDVFLRVWQHAALCKPRAGTSPRAWLYRIAYNRCMDILRQHRQQTDDTENLVSYITPEKLYIENDKQERIKQAIDQLPERQRTALYLCTYQGLSNREAANTLDISVEALESLLTRARQKLRKQIQTQSEVETHGKRSINE